MASSRRNFLAAGLALPVAATARPDQQAPSPAAPSARPSFAPEFRYRTLGKTGLLVTTLGFGCMVTSDGSVVQRAADMGITYFDTAPNYSHGQNERMVGAALKGKRQHLVLSTKTEANSRQEALNQLDKSLQELGTDFVDIWYLHGKSAPDEVTDDLIDAQQAAKKAGKIRFAGVSTHSGQRELIPWLASNPHVDVILTVYNFTLAPFMNQVVEQAAKAGKGVVAMKVMAGGTRRVRPNDPNFAKLQREGAMPAALKWVLRNSNVGTTVPSMTDMDQLDSNLHAMSQSFGPEDEKLLAIHLQNIGSVYCRMCGECDGQCRQGVPVHDVLRFLTYAEGYGQFALARERYLEMAPQHVSARCGDCPSCTVNCPYGVHVARHVARAQEAFA